MKELQSLALDVRVQDRDGNDIELSELCREEETPRMSKLDAAAIDEVLGRNVEDDSLRKSFLLEDEDGNAIEDEEDEYYEESEEDDDYGLYPDGEDNE